VQGHSYKAEWRSLVTRRILESRSDPHPKEHVMHAPVRLLTGAAALALAAATLPLGGSSAVAATPSETGCPAGFSLLSVQWLSTQGAYQLPGILDAAGNNDGYVCGKAIVDVAATHICGGSCGVPVLYNFYDNDKTPAY
jgi:hypothetical protein